MAIKAIAGMERQITRRRAELAEIERAIVALTAAPPPTPKPRKPNPIFRPGDIPKLTLAALREADGPIPVRGLVDYLLAAKGVPDAPQAMRDVVANRVRVYLWRAGMRGWSG